MIRMITQRSSMTNFDHFLLKMNVFSVKKIWAALCSWYLSERVIALMVEPDKKRTFFIHFFFMIDGWRPHDLAKFPLCRRTKVHIKLARLFFVQKLRTNVMFKSQVALLYRLWKNKSKYNQSKSIILTFGVIFMHWYHDAIWSWLIFSNGC